MAEGKFIFRVDSSVIIGTGHTRRCLNLAAALRDRGVECRFVQRVRAGDQIALIEGAGFSVCPLYDEECGSRDEVGNRNECWLPVSEETDATQTMEAISGIRADCVVVDHYAIGRVWERALRPHCGRLVALDDLADREHNVDVLIDQNPVQGRDTAYRNLVSEDAAVLCGPRYAAIGREYLQARKPAPSHNGSISRVLVYFGGVDRPNYTGQALEALAEREFSDVAVDVVAGTENEHARELEKQCRSRGNTSLWYSQPSLLSLLEQADLAIGGGGTTSWERCTLALPSLVRTVAPNQEPVNRALSRIGAARAIDGESESSKLMMVECLRMLRRDAELVRSMARSAWLTTDGMGSLRLAEIMRPTDPAEYQLRAADRSDRWILYDWANEPSLMENSGRTEPIQWDAHAKWFENRYSNDHCLLWIWETPDGLPVGYIRIEPGEGDSYVLSYGLDVVVRGRGLAAVLLNHGLQSWCNGYRWGQLVADVRVGNPASARALRRAGFHESAEQSSDGGPRFIGCCDGVAGRP